MGLYPRNPVNGVLASNGLTNPRRSSVLTFGQPARVAATKRAANVPNNLAAGPVEGHDHVQKSRKGRKGWKPIIRSVWKWFPSQLQVLDALGKCLPGDFRGFNFFFLECVEREAHCAKNGEPVICCNPRPLNCSRWAACGVGNIGWWLPTFPNTTAGIP